MKIEKFYFGGESKVIDLPIPASINDWFRDDQPDGGIYDGCYNYSAIVDMEVFGDSKQTKKAIKTIRDNFDIIILGKYGFLYINNAIILDDNINYIDELIFPRTDILLYSKDYKSFKVIEPKSFIGGGEMIANIYSFSGEFNELPLASYSRTVTEFTNFNTWDAYYIVSVNPANISMYITEVMSIIEDGCCVDNIDGALKDVLSKIENGTSTQDDLIKFDYIIHGKYIEL